MKRIIILALACAGAPLAAGCGGEPDTQPPTPTAEGLAPEWLSPSADYPLGANEPFEISISSPWADVREVRFLVDDVEIGACTPSLPGEDCLVGDQYSWTTTATAGRHTLRARLARPEGTVEIAMDLDVAAEV